MNASHALIDGNVDRLLTWQHAIRRGTMTKKRKVDLGLLAMLVVPEVVLIIALLLVPVVYLLFR